MTERIHENRDDNLWYIEYVSKNGKFLLTGYVIAQTWFLAHQRAEPMLRHAYNKVWHIVVPDNYFMTENVEAKQIEEARIVEPEEAVGRASTAFEEARAKNRKRSFRWDPSGRFWEPVVRKRGRKKP